MRSLTSRPSSTSTLKLGLCCMTRCQRASVEQVPVQLLGELRDVGMCADHAQAYQVLARI